MGELLPVEQRTSRRQAKSGGQQKVGVARPAWPRPRPLGHRGGERRRRHQGAGEGEVAGTSGWGALPDKARQQSQPKSECDVCRAGGPAAGRESSGRRCGGQ